MKLGEKTEDHGKSKNKTHCRAGACPRRPTSNDRPCKSEGLAPKNFHVIARSPQATWQSPGRWLCSQNHQEIATPSRARNDEVLLAGCAYFYSVSCAGGSAWAMPHALLYQICFHFLYEQSLTFVPGGPTIVIDNIKGGFFHVCGPQCPSDDPGAC